MMKTAEMLPARQDFSEALDTVFVARANDASPFDLYLVEVTELVSNEMQENFSLLFRGPVDAPPSQQIYKLDHKQLGEMDLFLVPVKKNESGIYYEAVFNMYLNPE
jgi:hypothetical protein